MDFSLSEDQALFAATVEKICVREYGDLTVTDPARTSADAVARRWSVMAEQGVPGLPFAAEQGGFGEGATGSFLALEKMGRVLAVEPYLPSVALAGTVLARSGTPEALEMLARIIAGEVRATVALDEPGLRYDYDRMTATAIRTPDGWRLNASKRLVLDGAAAACVIVFARDADGIAAFLVDPAAEGVTRHVYGLLDGSQGADFVFLNVTLPAEARLGDADLLDILIDAGNAAIAAECSGLVAALIDITVDYVKLRKQFGKPLSAFQVLQHRLVDMRTEWELLKSAAAAAAMAVDALDGAARRRITSAAKVQAVRAGKFVSQWAIQLHGAIGMTEECQVGWYARRLQMLSYLLGDHAHHLRLFAALAA